METKRTWSWFFQHPMEMTEAELAALDAECEAGIARELDSLNISDESESDSESE